MLGLQPEDTWDIPLPLLLSLLILLLPFLDFLEISIMRRLQVSVVLLAVD